MQQGSVCMCVYVCVCVCLHDTHIPRCHSVGIQTFQVKCLFCQLLIFNWAELTFVLYNPVEGFGARWGLGGQDRGCQVDLFEAKNNKFSLF